MAHCRDKVEPPITPVVNEERVESDPERRVLIFIIASTGYAHCYRADGADASRYWVRLGRETREARDGLLRELLVRKGQPPPWDRRGSTTASQNDIDLVALRDTLQKMSLWNPHKSIEDYVSAKESISSFVPPLLLQDGLDAWRPRNFSILLFGHDVTKHVPGAYVIFSVYRGKDRSEPTAERREIVGSILDQTRKIIEQLNAEAYIAYDESSPIPNQTKYPIRALQVAAVKSLHLKICHEQWTRSALSTGRLLHSGKIRRSHSSFRACNSPSLKVRAYQRFFALCGKRVALTRLS